jgi:diguanylate cyclase (GGDEF)-like protein
VIAAVAVLAAMGYVALEGGVAEVWFQVVAWVSIALFVWGLIRNRSLTLPWAALGLGWAMFATGDLLFALNEHVFHVAPFPSAADVFYLGGYVFLAGGLAALVRRTRPGGDRIALIDAGIILVPGAVVGWIYLVAPYAGGSGTSLLERAVAGAYPLGDVLCFAVLIRLFSGSLTGWRRVPPAMLALAFAFLMTLVADVLFVLGELHDWYRTGGVIDAMYLLPYVAVAACACDPSVRRIGEPHAAIDPSVGRVRLAFFAVAALVTPMLMITEWTGHRTPKVPLIVLATAVSFLLVIARMASLVDALEDSRAQLAYDATHDHLTGLANRSLFARHVDEVLARGGAGSLLFIDLDKFKTVNDRLGHHAGDELLIRVGELLRQGVRGQDVVARLAGDEFAVLLPGADERTATAIADRLISVLHIVAEFGDGVGVTASIGAVTWRGDRVPTSARVLLAEADEAMYRAKAADGNRYVAARR